MDIHVLYRQGHSIRSIAKLLCISRNTVKKHLFNEELPSYSPRGKRRTKLAPYQQYLHERIEAAAPKWIPASVLFLEIQQKGDDGGIAQLRRFVRPLKETKNEPLIRFETLPGEQMQIDFTTIRRGKHPVKAFVATLGYSRACYVRFYLHEQTDNWLDGIVEACHFFGGVPKEILCDNAKALVIKHDGYGKGEHQWNRQLLQLAKDYGFRLKACRPYRAKTKGKVERFNHYLKNSFVLPHAVTLKQSGLIFDCDYGNASVGYWLQEIAHKRTHGTTGERPDKLLAIERKHLQSLPVSMSLELEPTLKEIVATVPPSNESLSFQHPMSVYDEILL